MNIAHVILIDYQRANLLPTKSFPSLNSGGQITQMSFSLSVLAIREAILRSVVTCRGRARVSGVSIRSVGLLFLRID